MTEASFFYTLIVLELVLAVGVAASLSLRVAPYGRHSEAGWGPGVAVRLAWVIMESPAVLAFIAFFAVGARAGQLVPLVLMAMWLCHYGHRTLIYPLAMRIDATKRMPAVVVGSGFVYNVLNAYLNGRWLSELGPVYTASWLWGGRFLLGTSLFFTGFAINRWADRVLRDLRRPGESGYAIPRGGLYSLISCPNYFGELIQWAGFALAAWSPAGLAFTAFTAANLVPRAVSHHRWYRQTFPDYPRRRKAVIPFVL